MRKRITIVVLLAILVNNVGSAQHWKANDQRPLELLSSGIDCRIENRQKMEVEYSWQYLVNNKLGGTWASEVIYYDGSSKIKDLEVSLRTPSGDVIRKLRSNEIKDEPITSFSLFTDQRKKVIEVAHDRYPYIVVISYKKEHKGILNLPTWWPQRYTNVPVLRATYNVSAPVDFNINYKAYNGPLEPIITNEKKRTVWSWEADSLPVIPDEPYELPYRELLPHLRVTPMAFSYAGKNGSTADWVAFGNWIYQLNADASDLPEEEVQKVKKLTASLTEEKEKVKRLYTYLQETKRYVSVQVSTGGLVPFPASYVCEKGYGDCKALTHYMKTLLETADITSYYTLVHAGRNAHPIDAEFVASQFNHVILCVPLAKDTVWLECTSQENPAGYLGSFTSDREVLVVKQNGSFIARTPTVPDAFNRKVSSLQITLKEDGTLHIDGERTMMGTPADRMLWGLKHNTGNDRSPFLQRNLPFSNVNIDRYTFEGQTDSIPKITDRFTLTARNHVQRTGDYLLIRPISKYLKNYRKLDKPRQGAIYLRGMSLREDSMRIRIPKGYQLKQLPRSIDLHTRFGTFEITSEQQGDWVIITKAVQLEKGRFDRSFIEELETFITTINAAEQEKLVFSKML